MKKALIISVAFLPSLSFGQYVYYKKEKEKDIKRIWYLKDYGIKPNSGICYSAIMQKVIDSAYNLIGQTTLVFPDTGTYHYSLYRDFKGKKKGTIEILYPIGDIKCVACSIKKRGFE